MDSDANQGSAAQRARWLAELADAMEQAQAIAWRLGISEGDDPEAKQLYARLEAARDEVEALRRGIWAGARQQLDPIWMKLLAWQPRISSAGDPGTESP